MNTFIDESKFNSVFYFVFHEKQFNVVSRWRKLGKKRLPTFDGKITFTTISDILDCFKMNTGKNYKKN